MKNEKIRSVVVLTTICIIVTAILAACNFVTAPIIKKQEEAANSAAYNDILPGATNLVEVEGSFPATITKMMKDEGGAGYVFEAVTRGYEKKDINILISVDANGKIIKFDITNDTYPESKMTAADFETLYTGKNLPISPEPKVDIIANATVSSNAYKTVLNDVFTVFCQYAGVEKSDDQKLADLYSVIMPWAVDKTGTLTFNKIELPAGVASSIVDVYEPVSQTGYIVLAKSGNTSLAAGVNAYGKVYYLSDLDGNDMLGNSSVTSVIADIEQTLPSVYASNDEAILAKMVAAGIISDASEATQVDFGKVSSNVIAVYDIGGVNAYIAKADGFGGRITVCYVINANGEIVKYATLEQTEIAYEDLYGTIIAEKEYADIFAGQTTETVTEETFDIEGSVTFTETATKICWKAVKAAAATLNGEVAE